MPIVYIKLFEFFLLPLYVSVFFWIAKKIVKKNYIDSPLAKYFYLGLIAKLIGSIAFALMAQYFFKEGDTFLYFSGGNDFIKALFKDFPNNLYLLFEPASDFGKFYEANFENTQNFGYMSTGSNLLTAKISGFLSIFTFNGYLLTSVLFGIVAFSGMWQLFALFAKLYPSLIKKLNLAVLFLPSILYWGGGVMKDTICLGAIGWLFSSFYYYFVAGQRRAVHLLIIFIAFYTLYSIKIYIAVTILIVLLIWLVSIFIYSIKNALLRNILIGTLVVASISSLVIFADEILVFLNDQVLTTISDTIIEAKKNYEIVSGGEGATLNNLGDVNPTLSNIFSKIPIALNNALFRPYIWEARSLNIFLSAIENTILMIFLIYIFISRGIFSTFKRIFSNQLITIIFIFTILFAILIGLTCFNYGTLVRYKLPCMPFYCLMLVLLYYNDVKESKILK